MAFGNAKAAAPSRRRGQSSDLAARGLDRVHLVGHSMGGAIATLMALARSRRIATLTLLAPAASSGNQRALLRRLCCAIGKEEVRACVVACRPASVPPVPVVDALYRCARGRSQQILVDIAARDDQGRSARGPFP